MAFQWYCGARQGGATAPPPRPKRSGKVRRKGKGQMALGEAMWRKINPMQITIASFLAGTAIVAFSAALNAADGQPAITPAVRCEALVGLSFSSSTIVIENAEAVPE